MLSRSFLLLLTLFLAGLPLMISAQQSDGIIAGSLSVKFTEGAVGTLDISAEGATGLPSIDQLNAQFGVTGMARIFRPAGRFEERHRAFGLHRWYRLTIPQDVSVKAAVDAYRADPNIEIAEPVYEKTFNDGYEPGTQPQIADMLPRPSLNTLARPSAGSADIPNDPLFDQQWHYHNTGQIPPGGTPDADIDLPEAHKIQTGDSNVVVSIHDQGIQVDHEDLAANMWVNEGEIPSNGIDDDNNGYVDDLYGYNFVQDLGTIIPGDHGTHVAGTVAAVTNNSTGVAGVAGGDATVDSGVRVMSAQVFTGNTGGSGFAESYTYAADMGATISQNSWGYNTPGVVEQAVLDGIDYYIAIAGNEPDASMDGGLVIFAAGNANSSGDFYPGYYEPVVAVASSGIDDQKSNFSNYGGWVDITAPGGNGAPYDENDVLSTLAGNGYGYLAGTSMACPHASGVAALIVSQNLGTTNEQVRSILELTTDDIDPINPGYEGLLGTGRINAATAIGIEPDTTAPAPITDLVGTPDGDFVTLTWTVPDDDSFGVQRYFVRYALEPIENEDNWDNAMVIPAAEDMTPQSPGETEELVITGLEFETTYYFSVRSWDALHHLSDLSNSEEVTTLSSPTANVPTDPIEVMLPLDAQEVIGYTISNVGSATLRYTLDVSDTTDGLERVPVPKPNPSERGEAPSRDGAEEDSPGGELQPLDLAQGKLMGEGGPDEFGYRWIDSGEPGGPSYDWIDITETGTQVTLGVDDHVIVDLPFDFPYYENTFDWVAIQSKGALSFSNTSLQYINRQIPAQDVWNGILAGYWDDLNPSAISGGGAIYYDTLEDERFVVSWVAVPHFPNAGSFTFQIILDPSGGIVYQYQTIDGGAHNNSATVGIENLEGTDGLQVVYNAPYVEAGLTVEFTNWLRIEGRGGELAAGEEQTHTLTFNSAGLEPNTYTADMTVNTNESGDGLQEYVIPITLTAEGVGTEDDDLAFEGTHRLSAIAPNPISSLAVTTLEVAEAQNVRVELFDVRGRKVTTPFESTLAARTAEEISLDGASLAPGVYVLRISGETFAETRRVTVVR